MRGHLCTLLRPSHGENRGSSPLGSANNINDLHFERLPVSRPCPVEALGRRSGCACRPTTPTRISETHCSACRPRGASRCQRSADRAHQYRPAIRCRALEVGWPLTIDQSRQVTVHNTGAFQRTMDEQGFRSRIHKKRIAPSEALRSNSKTSRPAIRLYSSYIGLAFRNRRPGNGTCRRMEPATLSSPATSAATEVLQGRGSLPSLSSSKIGRRAHHYRH